MEVYIYTKIVVASQCLEYSLMYHQQQSKFFFSH